ncbi:flagellar biosynthetic protein FlhB [Clostridia bacterium]|nr:flagellar biosynthetic protein FlhB [Clostridia bacterium]
MPAAAQEKTEKATPKKRQDSRKKGQVLKSAEVNTAVMLLAIFSVIAVAGSMIVSGTMNMISDYIVTTVPNALHDMTPARIHNMIIDALLHILKILWPVLLAALVAGIGVNLVQVGFLFSTDSIKPKFSRISPAQGLKRIFSMRSVVELLKSLLKIAVVGVVLYLEYLGNMDLFRNLMVYGLGAVGTEMYDMCLSMAFKACMALVAIGLADYMYQWWEFEKNLRMTKQEIKDEWKMVEGDPKIKQAIKRRQREASMRRMMADIPKADVVITNPTHYAIALEYKDGETDAPLVVAKGKDLVAQNIKRKAEEHGIPMVENRPVAQALYVACDVGDKIPGEMFGAVAEILAYVFNKKHGRAAAAARPQPRRA